MMVDISSPYTCFAPAFAANMLRMPVPHPTSSTILSLKRCALPSIARRYVKVRTESFNISCCKRWHERKRGGHQISRRVTGRKTTSDEEPQQVKNVQPSATQNSTVRPPNSRRIYTATVVFTFRTKTSTACPPSLPCDLNQCRPPHPWVDDG